MTPITDWRIYERRADLLQRRVREGRGNYRVLQRELTKCFDAWAELNRINTAKHFGAQVAA